MTKKADKTIKTDWDLSPLYSSLHDPKIEADVQKFKADCSAFAKKYRETKFTASAQTLRNALDEFSQLQLDLKDGRPIVYLHLYQEIHTTDQQVQAKISKYTQELSHAENELQFFELEIGKIPLASQKKFLNDAALLPYRYYLERRFLTAQYDLSEKEENLINLLTLPAATMWNQGLEKMIGKLSVDYSGKTIPVTEAQELIPELPTKERRALHRKIMLAYDSVSDFAESELNAILTTKNIIDDLKGFTHPYSSRIIDAENNEKTVHVLLKTVQEYYTLTHRFYRIKTKLLKEKKLTYADRGAQIGTITKRYSFSESYETIRACLSAYDPEFSHILDTMISQGQIDAFPKTGKHGSAFQSDSIGNPTYILLNHTNSFDSVTTFAHELGHALHSHYAKRQPVLYQNYSLSTAETASTFFEKLVFQSLTENMNNEQKIVALHDSIQDAVSTVFRQVACFSFELDIHNGLKKQGSLSKEELKALHNTHMQAYLGESVKLAPLDGNFFIQWSHLRSSFYVYTYAFGYLVSLALFALVREDQKNIGKVIQFLSAGGSDTPEHIFQSIGIDVTNPKFFEKGILKIKEDIDELERLSTRS